MDSTRTSNSADMSDISANRVAIIGASGYGGIQSIRLLKDHPFFKVTFLGGATKFWKTLE